MLLSGHAQTGSVLLRRGPRAVFHRELLRTGDGGTVALDWLAAAAGGIDSRGDSGGGCGCGCGGGGGPGQPIVVVLHGLTGGSHESYVRSFAAAAARYGCGGQGRPSRRSFEDFQRDENPHILGRFPRGASAICAPFSGCPGGRSLAVPNRVRPGAHAAAAAAAAPLVGSARS